MEREEDESVSELLRDRFRLSTIHIAESEAKRIGMEISGPVMACISDLAFKFTGNFTCPVCFEIENRQKNCVTTKRKLPVLKPEQLAKDLELFTHHAGRKSANMEDVILCAHRNEHLAALLRSYRDDLKAKEPQSDRKRKKALKKDDRAPEDIVPIPDN
ncbi:hypothetical protein ACLB2K_044113 [Fragaria x ananassa]